MSNRISYLNPRAYTFHFPNATPKYFYSPSTIISTIVHLSLLLILAIDLKADVLPPSRAASDSNKSYHSPILQSRYTINHPEEKVNMIEQCQLSNSIYGQICV